MNKRVKLLIYSSLTGLVFMLFLYILMRLGIEHKIFPQKPDDFWEMLILAILILILNFCMKKTDGRKVFLINYINSLLCAIIFMNLLGFALLFI